MNIQSGACSSTEGSNSPLIVNKVQGLVTTFSVVFITIMLHKMNYTENYIGVYFNVYSISVLRIYHLLLYYSWTTEK